MTTRITKLVFTYGDKALGEHSKYELIKIVVDQNRAITDLQQELMQCKRAALKEATSE